MEGQLGPALYGVTRLLDRDARPYGLAAKLARIQEEIEDVPRAGHAEVTTKGGGQYSYDYILEADLMKAVRPLLAKYGVASFYRDEITRPPTKDDPSCIVRVTLTLVDGDSGQERELHADGYAIDYGDKAANKAKTSAVRYILWKTFLQPSDEDPEQENQDRETATQRRGADEARAGRSTRSRSGPDKAGLIQRINVLTVELDEVQGTPAGRALENLHDGVTEAHGKSLPDLEDAELVKIGKALNEHLTEERRKTETDGLGYTPTTFVLPD